MIGARDRPIGDQHPGDEHGRRLDVDRDGFRIEDGHAALRRKPDAAIARPDSGRLRAAVALRAQHAVAMAVRHGRDLSTGAVRERVELVPRDAIDAAVRANPEAIPAIFDNLEGAVGKETLPRREAGEPAVTEPEQS